ncbi:hypothetical protein LCGC14_0982230 [marine sediment metagenome]|uniref:Disease resistance R13L4/SHOC-2-like LRR domain-containing protein n=1 Tax=marine sediment metagenome TaxID=412755 RepID=A0A0F9QRN5_9ZZZZ
MDIVLNIIEVLPESIGKLTSLKDLILGKNFINTLPESIGNMSSLKNLDIGENPIKKLPDSILNLKKLETLFMKGLDKEFSVVNLLLKQKKVSILK